MWKCTYNCQFWVYSVYYCLICISIIGMYIPYFVTSKCTLNTPDTMTMITNCSAPVNTPQALNLNTYLSSDKTCNASLQMTATPSLTSACVGGVALVQCTDTTVHLYANIIFLFKTISVQVSFSMSKRM